MQIHFTPSSNEQPKRLLFEVTIAGAVVYGRPLTDDEARIVSLDTFGRDLCGNGGVPLETRLMLLLVSEVGKLSHEVKVLREELAFHRASARAHRAMVTT